MKKFLYIFIGMAIALGAVVLYSFKAKENAEVSYALLVQQENGEVYVQYSNGSIEQAFKLFDINNIGYKKDKGQIPPESVILKTLEYMHQKGYKVIGESQRFRGRAAWVSDYSYTLIKEN